MKSFRDFLNENRKEIDKNYFLDDKTDADESEREHNPNGYVTASSEVCIGLLRLYHEWLFENFDIKPKPENKDVYQKMQELVDDK